MRALTVRQPWAWAIIHGGKLIENRTARVSYTGPIAIHAAASRSARGIADPRIGAAAHRLGLDSHDLHRQPAGGIIGTAQLIGCHPDVGCCRPWGESSYQEAGGRTRTALWHWALDQPEALAQPVPCLGRLGLWIVEPWIAAEVP